MRIRSKVILFSLFFALASGAVMAWCYINIRREEAAFVDSRRAMKTSAAVADLEYFLVRHVRLLESYVLLGDESERLQLVQAAHQTRQRLAEWEEAVKKGEAHGEEGQAVRSVYEAIAVPANKIRILIAAGKRSQAVAMVEKEFSPASARALAKFGAIKFRVERKKNETELTVVREFRRNHMGLLVSLGLVVFFGLVFISTLYRAVMRPIQKMRVWADRVARGEKKLAMAAFSGQNELTELAQSIGEMAIQLTRPKAFPAPPPLPEILPVPRSPAPQIQAPPPPPIQAPLAPPTPPAPPVKEDFEGAVTEFREILTQMAGKVPPKSSR